MKEKKKVVGISKVRQLQNKSEIKCALFDMLDRMKAKVEITIPSKAKIMIKPNICHVKGYETGATVDPFIVKALIEWLLQNYDIEAITIGEADATVLNVDIAFKVLGWEDMFKSFHNVQLLNLTKDEYVNIELDGLYFKSLHMSKTYMESNFLISVAKLKTHTTCGITCVLKNQYGANPVKYKARYHKHLDEVIHDINKVRLPDLCLIDGVIGMEGSGPLNGMPKPLGLFIVGNDAVSVDHTCARIMGFNPDKISHLKLAVKKKLGSTNYEVFGERIEDVITKFEFVPRRNKIVTRIYQSKVINRIPLWKELLVKMLRG